MCGRRRWEPAPTAVGANWSAAPTTIQASATARNGDVADPVTASRAVAKGTVTRSNSRPTIVVGVDKNDVTSQFAPIPGGATVVAGLVGTVVEVGLVAGIVVVADIGTVVDVAGVVTVVVGMHGPAGTVVDDVDAVVFEVLMRVGTVVEATVAGTVVDVDRTADVVDVVARAIVVEVDANGTVVDVGANGTVVETDNTTDVVDVVARGNVVEVGARGTAVVEVVTAGKVVVVDVLAGTGAVVEVDASIDTVVDVVGGIVEVVDIGTVVVGLGGMVAGVVVGGATAGAVEVVVAMVGRVTDWFVTETSVTPGPVMTATDPVSRLGVPLIRSAGATLMAATCMPAGMASATVSRVPIGKLPARTQLPAGTERPWPATVKENGVPSVTPEPATLQTLSWLVWSSLVKVTVASWVRFPATISTRADPPARSDRTRREAGAVDIPATRVSSRRTSETVTTPSGTRSTAEQRPTGTSTRCPAAVKV